jgi:MFS family permease
LRPPAAVGLSLITEFSPDKLDFIEDAHLTKNAIPNSLSFFSITYVTLQPFATVMARKAGAKNWIAIMLFVWGTISMCHAAINSTTSFYALRILLGVAESGFTQTSFYYLSSLYPKEYLGLRMGFFAGMYAMANAFAGLIATGVLSIKSGRLHNWQILYLLEGGLTISLGFLTYYILPASPAKAWMLSESERFHAVDRMNIDVGADLGHTEGTDLTKRDVVDGLRDWRKLVIIISNIVLTLPVAAFSTFLPLIVKGKFHPFLSVILTIQEWTTRAPKLA